MKEDKIIKQIPDEELPAPTLCEEQEFVSGEIIVKFKVAEEKAGGVGLRFSPVQTYQSGRSLVEMEQDPAQAALDAVLMDPVLGINVSEGRKAFDDVSDTGDLRQDRAIEKRRFDAQRRTTPWREQAARSESSVSLSNIYIFSCTPGQEEAVVAALSALPQVEYAQVNHIMVTYDQPLPAVPYIPDDPFVADDSGSQWRVGSWGQLHEGEPFADLWGLQRIQLLEALNLFSDPIQQPGAGIIAAVVDTGVGYNHPDLAGNIWTSGDTPGDANGDGCPGVCGVDDDGDGLVDEDNAGRELGHSNYNEPFVMDDDENGYIDDLYGYDFGEGDNDPMDPRGHGTHVAGTIAAVANNGIGILGLAPHAKIMAVKGFPDVGGAPSNALANSLRYASDNGADVINNSWGFSSRNPSDPIIEDAVRYAHDLGSLVVMAAGNEDDDAAYYSPQNMTETLTVGAFDLRDMRSYFSNYGTLVDVYAPGGGPRVEPPTFAPHWNILSLYVPGTDTPLDYPDAIVDEHTLRLAGTSMACPHAVGLAALVWSANPYLSRDEVRQIIQDGSDVRIETYEPGRFGTSVAGSQDVLVIGEGSGTGYGGASIYRRTGEASWALQATLMPDVDEIGTGLGKSIALSGDIVVAGAPNDRENQGAVYVFQRTVGAVWRQQAQLTLSSSYHFGEVIAMSDNTIVVGTPTASLGFKYGVGAVHVYQYNGNVWERQIKLTAGDGGEEDFFGCAVALSGDTLAVGARGDDDGGSSAGAAYLFRRIGDAWVQQTKLTASDAGADDSFGRELALSEDTLVVGAPYDDDLGSRSGSAYVYRFDEATGWQEVAKLTGADGQAGDRFGIAVSVDADTVAIGTLPYGGDDDASGAAYVFRPTETGWVQSAKLIPGDGSTLSAFGSAVVTIGDTVVVGAPGDDEAGDDFGSAYVFEPSQTGWVQQAKLVGSEHEYMLGRFINAYQSVALTVPADCAKPIFDCNHNGWDDRCDLSEGITFDCNNNRVPDECDIAGGIATDSWPSEGDGIPDECQMDCNANNLPDAQEIADGAARDLDQNGRLDECDVQFQVPQDYPTIQEAVDAAIADSFVVLAPGVYTGDGNRAVLVNGKRLFIVGEQGPEKTIIDCEGAGYALIVGQSNTQGSLIHGLTVQNGFSSFGSEVSGGGIRCSADSMRISNCILLNNSSSYSGGAIYLSGANSVIENCLITGNTATRWGGGILVQGSQSVIKNCRITGNSAMEVGGGISVFNVPCVIENCLISGNSAATTGGAINIDRSSTQIRRCTVAGNTAEIGGGVFMSAGEHELINTLLWSNHAQDGAQIGLQAFGGRFGFVPVTLSADYSDVQGGAEEIYFGSLTGITVNWGEGNLDADPRFVRAPRPGSFLRPDYHLRSDSPCIDAGDPSFVPQAGEMDIDGDPRLRGARVDIGADEFAIDCNGNGQSDAADLLTGTSADCNGNGTPDECDVAASDGRDPVSEDCNDNGIPDECEFAPCIDCDVNGDGHINKDDRVLMNECITEPDPELCRWADLDGDGKISSHDRTLLQQCFSFDGSHMQLGK